MQIKNSGVIFRNPLPGHRALNAIYPFVLPLPDGDWVCALRTGSALYSPDGMIEIFRSPDAGATWQRQGPVFDAAAGPPGLSYAEGCLTCLADHTLVLRLSRVDMQDPHKLMYNPDTQGLLPFEICYLRSGDAGRTWSDPVVAPLAEHFDPAIMPAPSGAMIELGDGTWFQMVETWKAYDDAGPFDLNSYGLFSRDGGHSWGEKVPLAVADGRSYSHGQPGRLADGRVLVSLWTAEPDLQAFHDLHTFVSTDASAQEWETPRATGIPGQTGGAVELSPGRLLIIYSHREGTDQPGIKIVSSHDGGRSWSVDQPLTVWDAYGKEALGVAQTDTYPSSHDAIAYGAPRLVRLDQHRAVACFWCTQGGDTHCRWAEVCM